MSVTVKRPSGKSGYTYYNDATHGLITGSGGETLG